MTNVTINDIFYVLLTAAVPLVLRYVHQLVSAKTAGRNHAAAVEAVFSAVEYVNQTFVDSLKASGSFNKPAQEQALVMAKGAALDLMEEAVYKWAEEAFEDLDGWLTMQIEGAVKAVKAA